MCKSWLRVQLTFRVWWTWFIVQLDIKVQGAGENRRFRVRSGTWCFRVQRDIGLRRDICCVLKRLRANYDPNFCVALACCRWIVEFQIYRVYPPDLYHSYVGFPFIVSFVKTEWGRRDSNPRLSFCKNSNVQLHPHSRVSEFLFSGSFTDYVFANASEWGNLTGLVCEHFPPRFVYLPLIFRVFKFFCAIFQLSPKLEAKQRTPGARRGLRKGAHAALESSQGEKVELYWERNHFIPPPLSPIYPWNTVTTVRNPLYSEKLEAKPSSSTRFRIVCVIFQG